MNDIPQSEMPRYKCHKLVWALEIKEIDPKFAGAAGAIITPADKGYGPFEVSLAYLQKHKPEVGGYYVVYADGYKSYSPAEAFEVGYSLDQEVAGAVPTPDNPKPTCEPGDQPEAAQGPTPGGFRHNAP